MKIIINSAYLKTGLKNALDNYPIYAEITPDAIQFKCYKSSFDVEIHKESVKNPEEFKIKFDYKQWHKVFKLLKILPEQPIILDFSENDLGVRIEINGMCAIFN